MFPIQPPPSPPAFARGRKAIINPIETLDASEVERKTSPYPDRGFTLLRLPSSTHDLIFGNSPVAIPLLWAQKPNKLLHTSHHHPPFSRAPPPRQIPSTTHTPSSRRKPPSPGAAQDTPCLET
jgi:hypothetical protein